MDRASVTSSKPRPEFPGEPIGNGRFCGQLTPLQHMKTKAQKTYTNPYRISANETLENEGVDPSNEDSVFSFVRHASFDATAPACCSEGCVVEPDGTCPHGCPSVLLVIGMI